MGMIYAGILVALGVLLFLSRKEEIRADPDTPVFGRYFLKPALWLYKRCQKKETGRKLREELRLLYPAGGEERFRRYQVEKLSGLLLICFAAAVLGGLIRISGGMEQRLTEDGWLRRNSYGEGEADVRLKGQAAGTEGWEQEVELTVSERRYTRQELEEMVEQVRAFLEQEIRDRDKETQTREELRLPDEVDGEGVRYYPRLDIRGLVIMGMALMTGFLLLAKEKQDLLKEQQKRKEQMIRDYPEIISKLTLFLGAGMTVKRAWKKIITDYETKGKARGERYIYEEMIRTAREMDSGVMESESYERFGRRCQVQEYMRLGALLSQNLRKGTKGLTQMLRMEAIQAFEERKARAKRLGEEAGTKLLAPMFLMLAVVLVIVIVPAFLSIQL